MQKEIILRKLRERGCRITKQRELLLDIILEENCSCCKELHYKASKMDAKIGTATVYRMVNTLEEIGAIYRKNGYQITCDNDYAAIVELSDGSVACLQKEDWLQVVQSGMKVEGHITEQKVKRVILDREE